MDMNKGFTLIELMIVVAILGILLVVAGVAYNGYVKRTVVISALNEISSIKKEYEFVYNESYSGLSDLNQISIPNSNYCIIKIEAPNPLTLIATKAITCSFKNNGILEDDAEIYLSRNSRGFYSCHSLNIPEKFIPKECV